MEAKRKKRGIDPLKKAYGSHKGWKIDTQKVKDELRKDWGD